VRKKKIEFLHMQSILNRRGFREKQRVGAWCWGSEDLFSDARESFWEERRHTAGRGGNKLNINHTSSRATPRPGPVHVRTLSVKGGKGGEKFGGGAA